MNYQNIAQELEQTILGEAYYGMAFLNTLLVRELDEIDIACILRYATGSDTAADLDRVFTIVDKLKGL